MAYCEVTDLITGSLLWAPDDEDEPERFVNLAAEEMDSYLGFKYVVPVVGRASLSGVLALHEELLLKNINIKIASGRLLLAKFAGAEEAHEHQYGLGLLREGKSDLMLLVSGEVDLLSAELATPNGLGGTNDETPGIHNEDSESLLLGWENTVMRGDPWYSRPGTV